MLALGVLLLRPTSVYACVYLFSTQHLMSSPPCYLLLHFYFDIHASSRPAHTTRWRDPVGDHVACLRSECPAWPIWGQGTGSNVVTWHLNSTYGVLICHCHFLLYVYSRAYSVTWPQYIDELGLLQYLLDLYICKGIRLLVTTELRLCMCSYLIHIAPLL